MDLVQLCSSTLAMCGGGARLKEVRLCWEETPLSSFLSRGWRDLTTSGGLARKRPIIERPPGSMADTCREDGIMKKS